MAVNMGEVVARLAFPSVTVIARVHFFEPVAIHVDVALPSQKIVKPFN
jgi:hypothetical protein